jgi:hypothetical protein
MTLCSCQERPLCQWDWCACAADFSVLQPPWGRTRTRIKFMCDGHFQMYRYAMTHPIRGLTPPENSDEDWKPSLLEMIRHAEIAMAFEERAR